MFQRRHATEVLDTLYAEAAAGRDSETRAWLVAVAHPRLPRVGSRLTRDDAREILARTESLALFYAGRGGIHPLESIDRHNPRPGLRRWVAVNSATGEGSAWKEAWASIHHDGSVTIAAAVGGHRMSSDGYFDGWALDGYFQYGTTNSSNIAGGNIPAKSSKIHDTRTGNSVPSSAKYSRWKA